MNNAKKNSTSPLHNSIAALLIIAALIAFDQMTKVIAVKGLSGGKHVPLIPGVLELTLVQNRGAAFGILQDKRWVFLVVSSVAIVALFVFFLRKRDSLHPLARWGIVLVIAGGLGNMIDRVLMGYVVDFVDFVLIHFAVFNAADSFVTVGAALLFAWVLFVDLPASRGAGKRKKTPPPPAENEEGA